MNIYCIGHITNDLKPSPHVSGSVVYSAITAKQLGHSPTIITKCAANHKYIKDLTNMGIKVINLPLNNAEFKDKLTTFSNLFDARGNRTQHVSSIQESIIISDLANFPKMNKKDLIMIGSVIGEVDVDLINHLSSNFTVNLICQGYYRKVHTNGDISPSQWKKIDLLKRVNLISISDEDITLNTQVEYELLNEIKEKCAVTAFTLGEKGSSIFFDGLEENITPFPLTKNEIVELSGCGDVYTTVFSLFFHQLHDYKMAAVIASFITSLKIRADLNKKNFGPKSCVRKDEVLQFVEQNSGRLKKYLEANTVNSSDINLSDIIKKC